MIELGARLVSEVVSLLQHLAMTSYTIILLIACTKAISIYLGGPA